MDLGFAKKGKGMFEVRWVWVFRDWEGSFMSLGN